MTYQMDPLPYAHDALEPYLSKEIIHYHYDKRTQKYFDTANKLAKGTIYESMDLQDVVSKHSLMKMDSKLFIQASQAWNHQFYWASMAPKSKTGKISNDLEKQLTESFGGLDSFINDFTKKIESVVGSAWTWLLWRNGTLTIKNIPNAGTPLSDEGSIPLLVCDVWEHASELQYPADRKSYVHAFMEVINWDKVSERFDDGRK